MIHIVKSTLAFRTSFRKFNFSSIQHLRGTSEYAEEGNVKLRGVHIKSTTQDAPNLIFFPEIFDSPENWIQFFTNPEHQILQQRNVYILSMRNTGNSDKAENINYPDMANDVVRFMWEHKISTATLAGHGIGAKLALATGCWHTERVTGVVGFDSSPMNQHYIQPYQELVRYLGDLRSVRLDRNFTSIASDLKTHIKCPKWRDIFSECLVKSGSGYAWNFHLEGLYKNLQKDTGESLLNWTKHMGLFTGRAMFAFPEHSRYVHLGTNTIPMLKVCTHLKGFHNDIFSIQGDENPLSHWIYDYEDQAKAFATKLSLFLRHYDGVHTLLSSRAEVGSYYVNDRASGRVNSNYVYADYIPTHLHHNWRFADKK